MSAGFSYSEVAVEDTAVGLSLPDGLSYYALVQPSVPVRMRSDGTAPTASSGFRVPADVLVELDEAEARQAQFIAEDTEGSLRISYYRT